MAAVTSEILTNMLRSNFNDLKLFTEILNAELTEEGQGDENRGGHKEDIQRVLNAFGGSEAYLENSAKCLHQVEAKINETFEEKEIIEQNKLFNEIGDILKIIGGKDRIVEDEEPIGRVEVDENRIAQQLEEVQDILNEFHPLRLNENVGNADEEDENEEEERMSKQLEIMQKKVMSKLEKRMSNIGCSNDDDDNADQEYAAMLNREEELSDSSDDEAVDYKRWERCESKQGGSNDDAKKNMDARLKQMWNDYKKQLADVKSVDVKQLFTDALKDQPDPDFKRLKYFSQYNDSILELFSREAIMVVGTSMNYVDPISKKDITQPVRNKICNHIYEKDSVFSILRKKKEMRCPLPGCSCHSFTINDLVEDDEVATKISQNLAKKMSNQLHTEDMETDEEDGGRDAVDLDSDMEDTQSQELF